MFSANADRGADALKNGLAEDRPGCGYSEEVPAEAGFRRCADVRTVLSGMVKEVACRMLLPGIDKPSGCRICAASRFFGR